MPGRTMPLRDQRPVSGRFSVVAVAALLAVACAKPPELTRESMRDLIQHSPAFEGPWDQSLRFADADKTVNFRDVQRRLLKIESAYVRPDGPWGIAGTTATVVFMWRWQNGPLSGVDFRSTARLHCSRGVWKVYSDKLQEELWRAERGEE